VTDNGEAVALLKAAHSVLVIDWPSRDVPESLARAGYEVIVRGGPGPADYSSYAIEDGEVVTRRAGKAPEHVDLVYAFRPVAELPGIVDQARALGARAIWRQSGFASDGAKNPVGVWASPEESRQARAIAEAAGLAYIEAPYILDAVSGPQSFP